MVVTTMQHVLTVQGLGSLHAMDCSFVNGASSIDDC